MTTAMKLYSEIQAVKSNLIGSAAFNDIEGAWDLTEEQWEEIHDYASALLESVAEVKQWNAILDEKRG